tara:strand:- start:310 stop:729 length:420 start_codon:yes stop_codon:yes gene_type:complete
LEGESILGANLGYDAISSAAIAIGESALQSDVTVDRRSPTPDDIDGDARVQSCSPNKHARLTTRHPSSLARVKSERVSGTVKVAPTVLALLVRELSARIVDCMEGANRRLLHRHGTRRHHLWRVHQELSDLLGRAELFV